MSVAVYRSSGTLTLYNTVQPEERTGPVNRMPVIRMKAIGVDGDRTHNKIRWRRLWERIGRQSKIESLYGFIQAKFVSDDD